MSPHVALWRRNLLIALVSVDFTESGFSPVTSEVAGSSPVGSATFFNDLGLLARLLFLGVSVAESPSKSPAINSAVFLKNVSERC